ncbi:hypothetical protein M1523_02305 [Patescibacteria group bacterium]|nr:hypothetical protein [Patescibacteria group bacterium]MCL5091447.1 hypothetical protein [Patescibacteria group bacterium]
MNRTRTLIILLLLGLLMRIALSVVTHNGDVNTHIAWGSDIVSHGLTGLYQRNLMENYGVSAVNYPPITICFFALSYYLYSLIGPLLWKLNLLIPLFPSQVIFFWRDQQFVLPALMKLWAILADIGLAYVVYRFVRGWDKTKSGRLPLVAAGLILFNPAFFYNSAYWGQIDVIPLFFITLAFYLLLESKRTYWPVVCAALALLTKQTAIVFFPILALLYYRRFRWFGSVKALLLFLLMTWAFLFPFCRPGSGLFCPWITYWQRILNQYGSDYLTAHAFNFWGLITGLGHVPDSISIVFGLSARSVGEILVILNTGVILYLLHKSRYRTIAIFQSLFLIPFAVFLFATRMHERHLLLVLPFLLLFLLSKRQPLAVFIYLSLFHFYNLYSGWWSPHPPDMIIRIFSYQPVVRVFIVVTIAAYFKLLARLGSGTKPFRKSIVL